MRLPSIPLLCVFGLVMLAAAAAVPRVSNAELKPQVIDAGGGFGAAIQARDHAAFTRFIADEAVFFSGPTALRGRDAIAKAWLQYYAKPKVAFFLVGAGGSGSSRVRHAGLQRRSDPRPGWQGDRAIQLDLAT